MACLDLTPSRSLSWLPVLWVVKALKLAPSTAQGDLTGARSLCVDLGLPLEPFRSALLTRVLRGLRRGLPVKKPPPKMPITIPVLEKMVAALPFGILNSVCMAAACVGVYGLFRAGELVLKPAASSCARIPLRHSLTPL